jgi:hypothetical protein
MNQQDANDGIRPGFVVLLAGIVAAIVLSIWIHGIKPAPSGKPPEPARAMKPASSTQQAAIVNPLTKPAAMPTASAGRVATVGSTSVMTSTMVVAPTEPARVTALEKQWGIQITSVDLTDEDATLDLCYKITDPEKTALLYNGKTEAYLLDQVSGAKILMGIPPQGEGVFPLRSRARSAALMMSGAGAFPPVPSRLIAGRSYFILVPNPGKIVKRGNRVAVAIGDAKSSDVTVE